MSLQEPIAAGTHFKLVWAVDESGGSPARDFFHELDDGDKAKVLALFQRLATQGRIRSQEKFKKIEDSLWEFKSFQIRFLGDFRPGRRFVIALGLRKKKDRHRRSDLDRAQEILRRHDETHARN